MLISLGCNLRSDADIPKNRNNLEINKPLKQTALAVLLFSDWTFFEFVV